MKTFFTALFLLASLASLPGQVIPGESWEKVTSPAFSGWDPARLAELEEYIIEETATTGMMIVQNGRVVYEYGNTEELSYIASCRKSILAMLYGKYVADGTINLDQSLADLGIAYEGLLTDLERTATVKDIISSRSGIYLPASNPGDMTHLAPPRGTVRPGEQWLYNNWDFNMAGYIFEKTTGKNIYDDLGAQLALPLQFEDWDRSAQHKDGDRVRSHLLAYHMYFSTRDMARLGLLMLNRGKWGDQQIIPEEWVDEMTAPSTSSAELDAVAPFVKNEYSRMAYGYMWWLYADPPNDRLRGAYSAQGAYGQNITIIPGTNTVVVIKTNDRYERKKGDHSFIIDFIANSYDGGRAAATAELARHLADDDVAGFVKAYALAPPADDVDYETVINQLAYYYLEEEKDYDKALPLLRLNVDQHPEAWNVYDGLGEVLYYQGKYQESLVNYKKALELNVDDQWGNNAKVRHVIRRLEQKL